MKKRNLYIIGFLISFLKLGSAQKIIRGPYLQMVNQNSIIIRWRTDSLTNSKVAFGLKEGVLDRNATDNALVNEHIVYLSNLQPQSQYYYKIGYNNIIFNGTNQYFITAPFSKTSKKMRFAVYGDSGLGSDSQRDINKAFLHHWRNTRPDVMLLAGDNAYSYGTEQEYQNNFFNIYQDSLLKNIPLYPVLGNHDYGNSEANTGSRDMHYFKVFSTPAKGESGGVPSNNPAYYSFDYGNAHFIIMDTYGTEGGKKLYDTTSLQAQWLKQDLEKNNSTWTVAIGHHPPYTKGTHNSDYEPDLVAIRERIVPILERYGVDMAVFGHSHVYERSYLIKNHLGLDTTFNAKQHKVSVSSAAYSGADTTCFYRLPMTKSPHGTVYVVAGSAGNAGTAYTHSTFPHQASVVADKDKGGIFCFEIEDNRLDAFFIRKDTTVKDRFTMMKNVGKRTVINRFVTGDTLELKASFIGHYKWSTGQSTRSIKVKIQEEGLFRYMVQDSFKCVTDTFDLNLIFSKTDDKIPDFMIQQLTITDNILSFTIENAGKEALQVQIADVLGRVVMSKKLPEFQNTISLSTPLSRGVFLLHIRNEKGQFLTKKLMIF